MHLGLNINSSAHNCGYMVDEVTLLQQFEYCYKANIFPFVNCIYEVVYHGLNFKQCIESFLLSSIAS